MVSSTNPPIAQIPSNVIVEKAAEAEAKPLSKIQQLARARAAAKREREHDKHASASGHLATSLCKLRTRPREAGQANARDERMLDTRVASKAEKSDRNVVPIEPERIVDMRQSSAKVELARPSDFANVVLGGLSSDLLERKFTDGGFSCFIDGSKNMIKTLEKSFSEPSPDDIVLKAQSASKG